MTTRSGRSILKSLIAEELCGEPLLAVNTALSAAERASGPLERATHIIDAVCAYLSAGEARSAKRILLNVDVQEDPDLLRRIHCLKVWSEWLDRGWYPANYRSSTIDSGKMETILPESTNPETLELEAVMSYGQINAWSARGALELLQTKSDRAIHDLLDNNRRTLEALDSTTNGKYLIWSLCYHADLVHRAGNAEYASQILGKAQVLAEEEGDSEIKARTMLWLCDWALAPGSSPELLGRGYFQVPTRTPDLAQAADLLRSIEQQLGSLPAPRLRAALAMRWAVISYAQHDWPSQRDWLKKAKLLWNSVGETSCAMLSAVHEWIGRAEEHDFSALIEIAGCGWSNRARESVQRVLDWAEDSGSSSYCAGLGQILLLSAERVRGENPTGARFLYGIAYQLLRGRDRRAAQTALSYSAYIDLERRQPLRALIQLEQAMELIKHQNSDVATVTWIEELQHTVDICRIQATALGSTYAIEGLTRGLERSCLRLTELVDKVSGFQGTGGDNWLDSSRDAIEAIRDSGIGMGLGDYSQWSRQAVERNLQVGSRLAREVRSFVADTMAMHRIQMAERSGTPVHNAYARLARHALSPVGRARFLIAASCFSEAQQAVDELASQEALPIRMIAYLYLRARDFANANRIFRTLPLAVGPDRGGELTCRAEAALECSEHELAISYSSQAIDEFERRVGVLQRDPERVAAWDDVRIAGLFQIAMRANFENENLQAAIEIMEKARQQTNSGSLAGRLDDSLLAWRKTGARWSAALDRTIIAFNDGSDTTALREELERTELEMLAFERKRKDSIPSSCAISLATLQASIPHGTIIVGYLLVARDLVAVCISRQRTQFHYKHLPFGPDGLVRRCVAGWAQGEHPPEAEGLVSMLLTPFDSMMSDLERLVVIPFGCLYAIPWSALVWRGRPLAVQCAVCIAPSLEHVASQFGLGLNLSKGEWLAVGDPAFDSTSYPGLPRLPGAQVEARAIARLVPNANILIDRDATKSKLLDALSKPLAVLHLAAHGILSELAPTTSSLVLAGCDQISVADLAGLQLNVDLVILSACDTGRGAMTMGGDLVGLARTVLAAGARRCIVALWPVDDICASLFMHELHSQLACGVDPALALAMAQRQIIGLEDSELQAKYVQNGGTEEQSRSSLIRSGLQKDTCRANSPIGLHPDFMELDEGTPSDSIRLSRSIPKVWAAFELFGC